MGKKKQAQRTKNNAVPASSGRSAELLQSSSGVPFVGFKTLKQNGFIPMFSIASEDLDVTINEDFRLVLKKLNKKDTTTRLKALEEFKKLCQDCNVEVLKPVLTYWPRVYSALSTDQEHRVREAAHKAHRALVVKAGRNVAPYLKQLIGPWFTGQHDTYAPAASAAQAAFQETFPANKLTEAIVFCQEEILSYICDNLLYQTPNSLASDQNSNKEAKDARYERVIVSCLNGYALYLLRLPTEQIRKTDEANRKLITSSKFWKFNKDTAPIVRGAWFAALAALLDKASFLLGGEAKHVCMAVFTNLDESDPSVICHLWQAVLLTFTVFEEVWAYVSLEKLVLPKLWKVLRTGADGSATLVYPNLLPLLSKLPISDTNIYFKLFDNFQEGLKVRSVQMSSSESTAVITAFLECLQYLISGSCDNHTFCLSLIENAVFSMLEIVLSEPKYALTRPSLFSGVGSQVNSWSRFNEAPYITVTGSFWQWVNIVCHKLLESQLTDPSGLAHNCTAVFSLLTAFRNPQLQKKKPLKVKFSSPRIISEDVEEPVEATSSTELSTVFSKELEKCVEKQLHLCLTLMDSCGQQAHTVLVSHLAAMVHQFHSAHSLTQLVNTFGGTWESFYTSKLCKWLHDDNIPLPTTLETIFTFLQYVEEDAEVQTVFTDIRQIQWRKTLEWALKAQQQTALVRKWLQTHGEVCQLVSTLTRDDDSYNTIHNCLYNLRRNGWLTGNTLRELTNTLRKNLTDTSIGTCVKACSVDLLEALLHQTANHQVLAQLDPVDIQILLYELFTANLQQLPHFPTGWHHCISILTLQPTADLDAVCNTCVDLLVSVAKTRCISLNNSRKLMHELEVLVLSTVARDRSRLPTVLTKVLNRLGARIIEDEPSVWNLLHIAHMVTGSLRDPLMPFEQLQPERADNPLSVIPLQQYVTTAVPLLDMVVRLHTVDTNDYLAYRELRTSVPQDDLWGWTFLVLKVQAVCDFIQLYLYETKHYFLLREKIDYIIDECEHLRQINLGDLISHLKLSELEEDCRYLNRLQTTVVMKNLTLLYDRSQIQTELESLKQSNSAIKFLYFPNECMDELAAISGPFERSQLSIVNTCSPWLEPESHTPISVIDRLFDHYVAEEKENRSLLTMKSDELQHIAEVADFASQSVVRDSAHLKESSWDACLVATAALVLSVSTSLSSCTAPLPVQPPQAPPHATQPWPLALLSCLTHVPEEQQQRDSLTVHLARVVCSVCQLFNSVSAHMTSVDSEDKAAVIRSTEWREVFLADTQAALYKAWLAVAEMPCEWPARLLMIKSLGHSVTSFVEYPHFVLQDTLATLDTSCHLLQSEQVSVQLTAYHMFLKLIPAMIELDLKQCESNVALSCQHVAQALTHTQSIVETILSELRFGDLCSMEPFTDSYRFTLCYLLLWSALLELCAKAGSQLRALYTTWLKEEYLPALLKSLFCLMPESAVHSEILSQRICQLFSKPPPFNIGVWDSKRIAHLSCWIFAQSLRRLPAAIHQWWNEADHHVCTLVDKVTATYISPDLCAEELRSLQSQENKFENMTVSVYPSTQEVYAVYTFEDSHMELAIEMAHNHPLGLVKVRSGQRIASTTQTRHWLMQITILLTHQNGSIWDALELWKQSLDKRFEGVEECYICFAIIHSENHHQLPKISCPTCRKKFHSNCLYKWFTTSHKSTCPICRKIF